MSCRANVDQEGEQQPPVARSAASVPWLPPSLTCLVVHKVCIMACRQLRTDGTLADVCLGGPVPNLVAFANWHTTPSGCGSSTCQSGLVPNM